MSNAVDTATFSTAVRGYQRSAVDEVVARETARLRELHERVERLEQILSVLGTAAGVPTRKQLLRYAVDIVSQGWDDAVRITIENEQVVSRERAHAQGMAAAHRQLAERLAAEAEVATRAQADRVVAAAKQAAAQLLAEADAETERARQGADALIAAAAERAKEIARGFTETLHSLEEDVIVELTERQNRAEREVDAATAALRRAESDAAFLAEQAQAQRVAILAEARAQVAEIEESARTEMTRLQQETDAAVAELAQLMIKAGGRVPAVPGQAAAAEDAATVAGAAGG